MSEFVELTVVEKNSGHYDTKLEKIYYKCFVKRLYVNLTHIVCIEENESLKERLEEEDLIPGLDPNIASFSTITLGTPASYQKIDVVGKPSIILAKIRELVGGG